MLLFKKYHVPLILQAIKTQTRRLSLHVRVGSIQQARTDYYSPYFCKILILRVWKERLGDISDADAKAEGYANAVDFLKAFHYINKTKLEDIAKLNNQIIYAIEFKVYIEEEHSLSRFIGNKLDLKYPNFDVIIDILKEVNLEHSSVFYHSEWRDFPTWQEFIELISEFFKFPNENNTLDLIKKWKYISPSVLKRETPFLFKTREKLTIEQIFSIILKI